MATSGALLAILSLLSISVCAQQPPGVQTAQTMTVTVARASQHVLEAAIHPGATAWNNSVASDISSSEITSCSPAPSSTLSSSAGDMSMDHHDSLAIDAPMSATTSPPVVHEVESTLATLEKFCLCAGGQHAGAITTTVNGNINVVCNDKFISPNKEDGLSARQLDNIEELFSELGSMVASVASNRLFNTSTAYNISSTGLASTSALPTIVTGSTGISEGASSTSRAHIVTTASAVTTGSTTSPATTSTAVQSAAAPPNIAWNAAYGSVVLSGLIIVFE